MAGNTIGARAADPEMPGVVARAVAGAVIPELPQDGNNDGTVSKGGSTPNPSIGPARGIET